MKWFEGDISKAVATSKSRKAVFVVFIEGKDDTSAQFARTIEAAQVSSRLEEEYFVAIKVESGSDAYRFFAQIYQLVPVPSLFFIGENGTPLEIVAGTASADDLASKIDNVLTKAGKNNKHSSLNLIEAEQKTAAASSNNNNTATETAASNISDIPESDLNADLVSIESTSTTGNTSNNKTEEIAKTSQEATEPLSDTENKDNNETSEETATTHMETPDKEMTTEEKIERAQQLINIQRKKRLEEEEKKECEREIERRQMGRDVQKTRQMRHDMLMKQAYDERMREKAAEEEAREKVKQQILQDKLERKQKELELRHRQQQQQHKEQPKLTDNSLTSNATVTRIQFRLPSGNSHTGQFEPSSTLRTLRNYVIENIDLPFRQFSMSMSFPRRELSNEENDKTLLELGLVPSAVILILPLKNSNAIKTVTLAQDAGFLSRFMWPLLVPVIGVYNFISTIIGYLFGTNRNANNQRVDSDSDATEAASGVDRATSLDRRNVTQSSGLLRRYYSGNHGGTTIRAQGNIHRLHSGGDDNDENNTWNGNSTQQM